MYTLYYIGNNSDANKPTVPLSDQTLNQ